ncbi:hypothetical protein C7S18_08265 [Ahniella affigens]|uniref:Adenosine deaminase domain-containing protein n=1 Tax=Ahniella affigens TaxID=2021234 RepID=A0A2P1PQU7_9GAMM|nr:hypothetical protein [Ahniella affigens]AVP97188.1 hypothetical protein C7S18_08265 [Ahniella affigens]
MTERCLPPVLQALAWRLVDRDWALQEREIEDHADAEWRFVRRRLCEGLHGLPFQLALEALNEARILAPDPLDGLPIIAKSTLRIERGWPRVIDEEAWDVVCRIVDPDLIALSHPDLPRVVVKTPDLSDALAWPCSLRAQDTEFYDLSHEPVAEIHAHLGGSLPTPLLWSLFLYGHLSAMALEQYRPEPIRRGRWGQLLQQGLQAHLALHRLVYGDACIPEIRSGAEYAVAPAVIGWKGVQFDRDPDFSEWPHCVRTIKDRATLALLLPQRVLWYRACQAAHNDRALQEALQRLLGLRSAFNALLSQPSGQRGLSQFFGFYDRRSALWMGLPLRNAPTTYRGEQLGKELVMECWLEDRVAAPGASVDLELRLTLPFRGRECLLLIQNFVAAQAAVAERRPEIPLRAGLIHHTIKAAGRKGEEARAEFEALWHFLVGTPEARPFLVGVDAAANELACPPRTFSAAFTWLREQLDCGAPGQSEPPIRLGFTFHAGEDFRDLLTGLRHIDEAAHLLAMRPGDRIGHGLALSWPVDDFYISRTQSFPTVADHALDLCWAIALLLRFDGYGEQERDARDRLVGLLAEYGSEVDGLQRLIAQWDLDGPHAWASTRARSLKHRQRDNEPPRALREDEWLLLLGIPEAHWDRLAPRPIRPLEWQSIVRSCQHILRQRILKSGIVIEVNPSSNRIVGGYSTVERLPYTQISRPGQRAAGEIGNIPIAIGTDDAGIFHTSLQREYELVGRAALAQGYALPDVQSWLEGIRKTGLKASFLKHAPRGADWATAIERLLGTTLQNSERQDCGQCGASSMEQR